MAYSQRVHGQRWKLVKPRSSSHNLGPCIATDNKSLYMGKINREDEFGLLLSELHKVDSIACIVMHCSANIYKLLTRTCKKMLRNREFLSSVVVRDGLWTLQAGMTQALLYW